VYNAVLGGLAAQVRREPRYKGPRIGPETVEKYMKEVVAQMQAASKNSYTSFELSSTTHFLGL
jgi:hypothetical protein